MQVTIKDIVDFYNEYPEYIGQLEVEGRYGYKTIEYADVTAFDSSVICLKTENKKVYCSPDHKFMSDTGWKNAKDFCINDIIYTIDGEQKIVSISLEKEKIDLYDLQVEDVKEFYANGFVSHNSTILDALTFALFNKPFRKINKPQLLNSINKKDLLVEIEFLIGKNFYKVKRGIKPNIFEIYKNDTLLNQSADNKDYQDILEKQILKVNYKTFCQVVILGSASFVPFMQLPLAQRREIIEDLLDLQVFSNMNLLLKDKINKNIIETLNANNEKNTLIAQCNIISNHIQSLKESSDKLLQEKKERISHTNTLIQSTIDEINEYKNKLNLLNEQISNQHNISLELNKIIQYQTKLNEAIKKINKEIKFYHDNNNCPTCNQEIDSSFKCETIDTKEKKLEETLNGLKLLDEKYEVVNKKIKEYNNIQLQINDINIMISSLNVKISSWNDYIDELNKEIINIKSNNESNSSVNDLKKIQKDIKNATKKYNELIEEKEIYNAMSILLKDGGIKSKIIKQFIPIINKLINKYLSNMNFFVNFELNEQFEETIKSRYRDEFSYSSFSEGEKTRINIAILFAWRAISKMRNSINTNLLIMDEIFDGSLDGDGIDEFVKILESLTTDTNIFIISHKTDQMQDKFENTIKFNKINNSSRVTK